MLCTTKRACGVGDESRSASSMPASISTSRTACGVISACSGASRCAVSNTKFSNVNMRIVSKRFVESLPDERDERKGGSHSGGEFWREIRHVGNVVVLQPGHIHGDEFGLGAIPAKGGALLQYFMDQIDPGGFEHDLMRILARLGKRGAVADECASGQEAQAIIQIFKDIIGGARLFDPPNIRLLVFQHSSQKRFKLIFG